MLPGFLAGLPASYDEKGHLVQCENQWRIYEAKSDALISEVAIIQTNTRTCAHINDNRKSTIKGSNRDTPNHVSRITLNDDMKR